MALYGQNGEIEAVASPWQWNTRKCQPGWKIHYSIEKWIRESDKLRSVFYEAHRANQYFNPKTILNSLLIASVFTKRFLIGKL